MDCAVIHYHEIALKGKNRSYFTTQLVQNIRAATRDLDVLEVAESGGRLVLVPHPDLPEKLLAERLRHVFGVANFSFAIRSPLTLDLLKERLARGLAGKQFSSFAIDTRRSYKKFPLDSMQVNAEMGAFVQKLTGARVDLTHPELTISIRVTPRELFCFLERIRGAGGLPVGTAGQLVCLLSGGFDSPVAAYRMMGRGARIICVHYHSYPYLRKDSVDKAKELAEVLTQYQNHLTLYLVPLGELQRQVVLAVPPPNRVILYRRFMMRIARQVALRHGARALVTGESLSQVASQTLDNLVTIEEAVDLPILRPLIGMDKQEIIDQATRLGTFEISAQPDQDCCQLFVPKHPALRARVDEVRAWEARLPVEKLVEEAVAAAETLTFAFPPAARGGAPA